MAAIFSRWRLNGILVLKKLKVQLKIAHITRKNDRTIQNEQRKYQIQNMDPGTALGAYPASPPLVIKKLLMNKKEFNANMFRALPL